MIKKIHWTSKCSVPGDVSRGSHTREQEKGYRRDKGIPFLVLRSDGLDRAGGVTVGRERGRTLLIGPAGQV
jgi:hypothetical protein